MSNPTGDALVAIGLTETQQHLTKEDIHAALEAAASPSLVPDASPPPLYPQRQLLSASH
jgi:hypothetical protein